MTVTEILNNATLLSSLMIRDGAPMWIRRLRADPDQPIGAGETPAGPSTPQFNPTNHITDPLLNPAARRRERVSRRQTLPADFIVTSQPCVRPPTEPLPQIVMQIGSDTRHSTREPTQTDWSLPSSRKLDPFKPVNVLCWVVGERSVQTLVRTVAVCCRRSGELVLFDHKLILSERLGIEYRDELWKKAPVGWELVNWHVPIAPNPSGMLLLKTRDANTDGWVFDA
jgi:hypothetical protein